VEDALVRARAEHLACRRIETLSSGERQRVALAGVLAMAPRALALDEPTSQLDAASAEGLSRVLAGLRQDGVTILVTEHRPERLAPLAPTRLVLRDGRLVEPREEGAEPAPRIASGGPIRAELSGVVAGYGEEPVLIGCDLALRAGNVTALSGPNGSGKSTLLRVLAGLHPVEAGRVVLDGRDVTGVPAEERAGGVAFLAQDPGRFLLTESVSSEVAHAVRARGGGRRASRRCAPEILRAWGLASLAERHPHDLSVGERERVALAAALAVPTAVVALDEPTRGMDVERKRELAARLRSLAEEGVAVVVATHDERFARAVADRQVGIEAGRIAGRQPAIVPEPA
jgi:energy-coupling factor transporter ATP-binding protein EcfA2